MKTYQYIWRMICYRPRLYVFNGVLGFLVSIAPVVPGLIAQQFFNALPKVGHLNAVLWMLIAFWIVTVLARVSLFFVSGWVDTLHRFSMSGILRHNLLKRILESPGAQAIPGSSGEAISSFRDDVQQAEDAISWTLDCAGLALFAVVALIILLKVDFLITVLVFIPLVVVVALVESLNKRLEKYRQKSRNAAADLTSAIGEIFGAVQAIQVAAAEPHVIKQIRILNERQRVASLRDSVLSQILDSTFENTVGLGTGFILILAAQSIRAGRLGIGDLALFIYYLAFVTKFTRFFGMFLAHYTQTKVAFQRMCLFLQGAPSEELVMYNPLYLSSSVAPRSPLIKTAKDSLNTLKALDLTYYYPDTGRGIEGISFHLRRGSLTVITGRIASGKTTLLRVLLGLLPKDVGEIRWNDNVVDEPASFFIPPRCAYTPQIPHLFSATLKENVLIGLSEDSIVLDAALNDAVMERDIGELENGLETVIGTGGVKLSGGQAQRVAAARMLVRNPELLVFDDLSSALDVETEHLLWERLFKSNGRTFLVVSNRRAILERADHIIVLREGKVDAEGSLQDLLRTSEEMQILWHADEYNGPHNLVHPHFE